MKIKDNMIAIQHLGITGLSLKRIADLIEADAPFEQIYQECCDLTLAHTAFVREITAAADRVKYPGKEL